MEHHSQTDHPRSQGAPALSASAGVDGSFEASLRSSDLFPLRATGVDVLQVNLGRLCNQSCAHCHVQAGPDCVEVMSRETARQCLETLIRNAVPTLDLTGGAPELNPSFRFIVDGAVEAGRAVMVRTNLTVLLEEGNEGLPEYLAKRRVHVIASMPCYTEENVDAQRGQGVYRKSVQALQRLNAAGYGVPGGSLQLSLVYNPGGPFLPGPQAALESDYRRELRERHGVEFTDLFTIANMPIGRFRESLKRAGELDSYTELLKRSYNPEAAAAVMCRRTVSVGWDGRLYDCDFNQMLDLQCGHGVPAHIKAFDVSALATRQIVVGPHCFGCTAGAGSSCGGALV